MSRLSSEVAALATRARHGDRAAGQEFKQSLETAMVHIVRWTLQSGAAPSDSPSGDSPDLLARHILAEARRLAPTADFAQTWQSLSGPVAQRVCEVVLANMSPAVVKPENLRDTICN